MCALRLSNLYHLKPYFSRLETSWVDNRFVFSPLERTNPTLRLLAGGTRIRWNPTRIQGRYTVPTHKGSTPLHTRRTNPTPTRTRPTRGLGTPPLRGTPPPLPPGTHTPTIHRATALGEALRSLCATARETGTIRSIRTTRVRSRRRHTGERNLKTVTGKPDQRRPFLAGKAHTAKS